MTRPGPHLMKDEVEAFAEFLVAHGAEMLKPTNPYEVLRYRLDGMTFVLYRKETGAVSWTSPILVHWQAHKEGRALSVVKKRPGGQQRQNLVRALFERDGDECFYCGRPLGDDITVEHILSKVHGGKGTRENCALAHEACNQAVDDLSIAEKIRRRDEMRAARGCARPTGAASRSVDIITTRSRGRARATNGRSSRDGGSPIPSLWRRLFGMPAATSRSGRKSSSLTEGTNEHDRTEDDTRSPAYAGGL